MPSSRSALATRHESSSSKSSLIVGRAGVVRPPYWAKTFRASN